MSAFSEMNNCSYYVYILTNRSKTVFYTGVTNNLARRLLEHYSNRGKDESFAGRYYAYNLVYYETFEYVNDAIHRETEIKQWERDRKLRLINKKNPTLRFLNEEFCKPWPPVERR